MNKVSPEEFKANRNGIIIILLKFRNLLFKSKRVRYGCCVRDNSITIAHTALYVIANKGMANKEKNATFLAWKIERTQSVTPQVKITNENFFRNGLKIKSVNATNSAPSKMK